jgi:uncharacterized protein YvpB
MKRDDKGQEVKDAQALLLAYGLQVHPDGTYGAETEAAVYMAQRRLGVDVDGQWGPATEATLRKVTPLVGPPLPVFRSRIQGVHWHSQRDNTEHPSGTCNVTSLAMVLEFRGVTAQHPNAQLEDELFERLLTPEGVAKAKAIGVTSNPWTNPSMLTWLVQQVGHTDDFSEKHTWSDIWAHVEGKGVPVVISGRFTSSGHIVVILGRTTDGDFVIHDPYGNWTPSYGYTSAKGDFRVYPKDKIEEITLQASGGMRAHLIR